MYRILSFVFALFMFVSCGSGNSGISSKPDTDNAADVNDTGYENVSDEDSVEVTTPDEVSEPDENQARDGNSDPDENPDTDEIPNPDEVSEPAEISDSDEVSDSDEISDPYEVSDLDEIPDPDEVPEEIDDFDGDSIQIRIVAGNITSGNKQSYDPGHGIRIFKALKPDIALVQEMNYKNNSASDYKNFAQEIVGTNYYAVDNKQKCNNNKCNIPNGIVSKYPITDSDSWDDPNIHDRALLWAIIDIPGKKDIFAISVHLHTKPPSDQVKAAQVIVDEIKKLESSKPGRYYYVVGGDFNGPAAVSSDGFGKNNTFYVDGPDPVDEKGNSNTDSGRDDHYDFVLADYQLHGFQIPVVYYSSEDSTKTKTYENGFVFDTRLYNQSVLDEYFYPADKNDSGASQMQHMAVVKDFLIELK